MSGNFLEIYMHAAGKSDIPPQYHRWVALTIIAAAVADRVWMRKSINMPKIIPNMYTILVGPTGVSKGLAIDFGLEMITDRILVHYGSATYKSLIDYMVNSGSQFLLVMPELASDLGGRRMADMMIKHLTEWYTAFGRTMTEGTRLHGIKTYEGPTINAILASTPEWLVESISREAVASGFFGRSVVISAPYDLKSKIYQPTVPTDYDECLKELQGRLLQMTYLEGEFKMTHQAKDLDEFWFNTRREPLLGMEPFYQREPILALKLAMIMSLTDSFDLVVDAQHIEAAQKLLRELKQYMPQIMEDCLADDVTRCKNSMSRTIHPYDCRQLRYIVRLMHIKGFNMYIIRQALLEGKMEQMFEVIKHGDEDFLYLIPPRLRTLE